MSPIIETDRLILRRPEPKDAEAEIDFLMSQRSVGIGGPLSRELAWRSFATILGHWEMRGYGFFAVEDKEGGAYLGRVGPWFPEGWPEPEIGWSVVAAGEGRGVAREAAVATRRYAYETLGWTTAISLIDVDNTRSATLAERIGARRERLYTHERFGEMNLYRHPGAAELSAEGAP